MILNEAYALFASEGYEATTLNKLSQALKVSKPALYYYFDSKETLFEALYQSIADLIKADLDKISINSREKFHKSERHKDDFKEIIYCLGQNDFEGLSSDPNLAKVLRQFDLLRFRQASINEIAISLEQYTEEIYDVIFTLASEANLYSQKEIDAIKSIIKALINGFNYQLIFENSQLNLKTWQFALDRIL